MSTARPFAYNTGSPIAGTEQVGDLAVGFPTAGFPSTGLQWWNGPDEDLGYVIAHTVPSGNQPNPLNIPAYVGFYRSPLKTEQSFVDMVNQFFNQTFTTGNQCKTYLNNNGYWTSYVSNLVLHLDASDINSYPGSGTVWYDISGNGNHVTMVNSSSITWNNTGPVYFSTGSNGWFDNPSGTNLPVGNSEYTFIVWVKLGSSWSANGFMSVGPFGGSNQANAFRAGTTNQLINYWWANDLSVTSSLSPTDNWFNAVCKFDGITRSIWVNGVLVGSDTPVGHNVTTSALQIAKTTSTEYLNGEIGEALIYNIALSNSQIVQYYNNTVGKYAGLVLSLDAGNPLSYPGTGTTWTDLVGGKVFNLINGPGFDSGNGGKFYFYAPGGQYAECSTSLPSLPQFTTSVWHYWDGTNTGAVPTILTEVFIGGPINYFVGNLLGVVAQAGYFNGGFQVSPQFTLIPNNWYQIVTTCDSSQVVKVYVNNTLISTTPTGGPAPSSSNAGIRLMRRWDDPDFWGGYLATVDVYDNALSATQIANIWNSTKSRFGL